MTIDKRGYINEVFGRIADERAAVFANRPV